MMTRLIAWIHRITAPRSVRTAVCDLPEEWGPRMRVDEMRAFFVDPRNEGMIRALVQVLWMHRRKADEDARDCAVGRNARESAGFYLGSMDVVDNVMADVQLLTDAMRKPDEQMKRWFKAALDGEGGGEGQGATDMG